MAAGTTRAPEVSNNFPRTLGCPGCVAGHNLCLLEELGGMIPPQTTVDRNRKKKGSVIRGASSDEPPLLGGTPTSLSFKNTDFKQQNQPGGGGARR